jgi:hypothetical protein
VNELVGYSVTWLQGYTGTSVHWEKWRNNAGRRSGGEAAGAGNQAAPAAGAAVQMGNTKNHLSGEDCVMCNV